MGGAHRLKDPAAACSSAVAASGCFSVMGSRLSFFLDDWVFILYRAAYA